MNTKVWLVFLAVICGAAIRAEETSERRFSPLSWNGYTPYGRLENSGILSAVQWLASPVSARYIGAGHREAEPFSLSLTARIGGEFRTMRSDRDRYVFIPPSGVLPEMSVSLLPDNLPGKVRYRLRITYDRNGRNDSHTYEETIDAKDKWDVKAAMGDHIRGGQAVLACEYGNKTGSITFYIRGLNPVRSEAESYIRAICGLWYAGYVGIHESGSTSSTVMKQFNERGEFNSGTADIRHTPNASADFGFGIFQLTIPVPTSQHLWNWKANCEEGVSRLVSAQDYADKWMKEQRQQMEDEGFSIPVPVKNFGNVRFEEGTSRTIEHAVALKRYNGASDGNFCVWDNVRKQWKFNETNQWGINYVELICREVP